MTSQEKQVRAAAVVFRDCLEVMNSRAKKYGSEDDGFANIRGAADISDTDETQGIMTRFGDKVGRIKMGLRTYRDGEGGPAFEDESFRDSVIDGINYLALLLMWMETGGGENMDEFIENAGLLGEDTRQKKLFEEEEEEEEKGWFEKLIRR